MNALAAGFLLGLAGSAHCLGMCGPLTLLGRRPDRPGRQWLMFASHQTSRLVTYAVLGAIAGAGGSAIAHAGWRNSLAIGAGVLLIAQATGVLARAGTAGAARLVGRALGRARVFVPSHPLARAGALGVLNGLLPCGLLYAAIAASAGFGDLFSAMTFMTAFGAASVPVFAALAWSAAAWLPRMPRSLTRVAPIALTLIGLMLIARGIPAAPHAHAGH